MPDRIIRGINGPRGTVLLAAGLLAWVHVLSCLPLGTDGQRLPLGLELLDRYVPLPVYAGLWGIAAVLAWTAAFRSRTGKVRRAVDVAAFGVLAGLFAAWCVTYILGWWFEPGPTRAWIGAGLYLSLAGMVAGSGRMLNPNPDGAEARRRGRVS